MNPITKALEEGYSEDEVLGFIANTFPNIRNKIIKASQTGYTAKDIIKFLSGIGGTKSMRPSSEGLTQQAGHAIQEKEDRSKMQQLLKAGLSLAGGAAAGRVLTNAAPKIAGLLSKRGIPKTPGGQATGLAKAGVGAAQAASGQAPASLGINPAEIKQDFDRLGLTQKIESLSLKQPSTEVLGGLLYKQIPQEEKDALEEKYKTPFSALVKDYADQFLKREKEHPLSAASLKSQFERGQTDEEAPSPQKMAMLPDGQIGNLVDERQGIATVELPDGKTRTRKLDELIQEPEDAAVTALELIKSFTPEEQRSTHHSLSFYDPDEKSAFFLFHSGDAYKVDEVTPEDYQNMSQEVIGAKTTGETLRGQWSAGAGSRGAAYNLIVKAGKKPYKKLQVGYDIFREFQKRISEAERKRKRKRPE